MKISNSVLKKLLLLLVILCSVDQAFSQDPDMFLNSTFLKRLSKERSYSDLKKRIVSASAKTPAGNWGEFVTGVDESINTKKKIVAFTFDACGGKHGSGCDKELIEYLHKEEIPATLFISGKWIDSQFTEFLHLSRDTLFEIENHGLNHKPCTITGQSAYGIKGTSDLEEAFDEIEGNARKIEALTKHRPLYFRSATAFIDEASARMAMRLGITTVSYQVLSGDAVPFAPEPVIEQNVLNKIKPGAIVIMHFNHPEWNTKEAMEKIVPKLRKMGYSFVRLRDFKLRSLN
jgi:peptidoglycan/xylan/chitin deacetylase (PgdA/CDA1 family)